MDENTIKNAEELDNVDKELKLLKLRRKLLANNTPKEGFDASKFNKGMFNFLNPVLWIKDLVAIFNIRKIFIYLLIVGLLFGGGWWKGRKSQLVLVNVNDFIAETSIKEGLHKGETLRLEGDRGHLYYQFIRRDGSESQRWIVKHEDIPALKPYGIELKPKIFAGMGIGGPAVGAGFEIAHFWRLNLDVFGMSDKTIYIGMSYDLETKKKFLKNSSVGLALGKSISKTTGTNVMIYWSWKF